MKQEVFMGLVRHVLTAGGGFIVSLGYVTNGQTEILIGAALAIAGVIWSAMHKKKVVENAK